MARNLGWLGIIRLGLVQTSLGAMVVLATSTFNRVMVVELALPAMLPGLLVAVHYVTQIFRPRMGYGSDVGGRSTPWIVGGMCVLGLATLGAAIATTQLANSLVLGTIMAIIAYFAIGLGVGAAGTSLLVLLAKRVVAGRRAAAASVVWLMMIAGFAVTATLAGKFLDPYTPMRLVEVSGSVVAIALCVTFAAVWGLEQRVLPTTAEEDPVAQTPKIPFRVALAEVWSEPEARRFTIFVFISMLAYSAQDLILEPFAGVVFDYTVGQSTSLSGIQHQGVFVGMLGVAVLCSLFKNSWLGSLKMWTVTGCLASAAALWALSLASLMSPDWPLRLTVFLLGAANGAFAVAAIGSMMANAGRGTAAREGVRMGLWGAAQAFAFGLGGFAGTAASDLAHALLASPVQAYAVVFGLEGGLFLLSAVIAGQLTVSNQQRRRLETGTAFT
ncbi:MAG: BCD family MFS transporter [Gammaproteobacteria bacterium]|nr:BCD family MFS transporter [Gammaproteobacteria bacterium]